ncbi:MAG: translation initiation factor IF-2 subunit gamma [Candidatus Aenigmarchaeota archaeon]|nr:translation initiation factor IF-2 subunit gamma [Candidatus Aenigmarchaeota archaeon]
MFTKEEKGGRTEVSIGVVGHVDHGKTTLVKALTGKWTSTYSEELKRGITIRLGYADAKFYYCEKDNSYCPTQKCSKCFGDAKFARAVSFVDAPGHETLMATVLSGAALMDGALLIISATEKCPRPQTAEHLKALEIAGIGKIVIVQNKIDAVDEKRARESCREIKDFVKGSIADNSPIIPVSALHNANIDILIETIEKVIETPERSLNDDSVFYAARSFDVNKPGTDIEKLKGGVIGGALSKGSIEKGSEIEIAPGFNENGVFKKLKTKVVGIVQADLPQEKAYPGGLVALETSLDPSLTRGDVLAGNLAGLPGKLPECKFVVKFKPNLFDYVIGVGGQTVVSPIKTGDALLVTHAVEKSVGAVTSGSEKGVELKLKIPLCVQKGDKIALSRQSGGRWHLIGWGEIV